MAFRIVGVMDGRGHHGKQDVPAADLKMPELRQMAWWGEGPSGAGHSGQGVSSPLKIR